MIEFRQVVMDGVERRFDPLTGGETRINPARAGRLRQGEGAGRPHPLGELARPSQPSCPFCPERVEALTPTFPPGLVAGGRVRRGETTFVPNLHPFAQHSAVGILCHAHFLDLDGFSPGLLADNLLAAQELLLAIQRHHPRAQYPTWVFNYMPPSAGSILHPHSQLWVEEEPLPGLAGVLRRSRQHYEATGRTYWQELAEVEKARGERFIGENPSLWLLTTFAPVGFREVQFIFKEGACLAELKEGQVWDFAQALGQVLRGYKGMGVGSFNLASLSAGWGEDASHFRLSLRLFSRPYPGGVYTNDSGPMERLYGVRVIDTLPEEVASELRGYFPSP